MKLVIDTCSGNSVCSPCSPFEADKLCNRLNSTQREIQKPERFTVMSVEDYYKKRKESREWKIK